MLSESDLQMNDIFQDIINSLNNEEKQQCLKLRRHTCNELLDYLSTVQVTSNFTPKYDMLALYGSSNNTVLHCIAEAPKNGDSTIHIANLALQAGVDVNALNSYNGTALHLSVLNYPFSKTTGLAKLLLEKKADPNTPSAKGNTALHIAARLRAWDLVELLLEHKANPNVLNSDYLTPRKFLMMRRDISAQDIKNYDDIVQIYLKNSVMPSNVSKKYSRFH